MKYIDRGKKDVIALIPGWATDYRIFDLLDLNFNYLLPINFSPYTFEENLLEALKENNINKISLFGWSLGGFVAQAFSIRHADLIDKLILISVRKAYEKEGLAKIRASLKKNKKGYLYKFYNMCFYKKNQMDWFKKNLLRDYCKNLDLNFLLKTLDYLEGARMRPAVLSNMRKIKIVHGRHDSIAPIQEAKKIKERLPQAKFISIKDSGHMPFLKKDFLNYIW